MVKLSPGNDIIMKIDNLPLLEFVKLNSGIIEENTFKKILSLKTLKEISFYIENNEDDFGFDIFKIDIQNFAIKKLNIEIIKCEIYQPTEISFFNLENKFPNLLGLNLSITNYEDANNSIKI